MKANDEWAVYCVKWEKISSQQIHLHTIIYKSSMNGQPNLELGWLAR